MNAEQGPDGGPAQMVAGQVDSHQSNRRGAALGAFREDVDPTLLATVIAHHLEPGLARINAVLLERLVVIELERLHRVPLSDQPERIRALGVNVIRLADILAHADRGQVAA